MIDLGEIIIGWKNFIVKNSKVESLAEERMKVCLSCEKLKKDNHRCSVCGCYMVAKTRNPNSTCPLDKWNFTDEELEEQTNLEDQ